MKGRLRLFLIINAESIKLRLDHLREYQQNL